MAKTKLNIGVNINRCDRCEKMNMAIESFEGFKWQNGYLLSYDKVTETILIDEHQLMRIIQMANPIQQPRKIKLINRKKDDLI